MRIEYSVVDDETQPKYNIVRFPGRSPDASLA
jgi:hypothetical protein